MFLRRRVLATLAALSTVLTTAVVLTGAQPAAAA
jgi:hypothetical protein